MSYIACKLTSQISYKEGAQNLNCSTPKSQLMQSILSVPCREFP